MALCGLVLAAWLLYQLRAIILYLILAASVALMGRPVMNFLSRLRIGKKHLPKWACSLLTILLFLIVLASIFALFVPLLIEESKILSNLKLADIKNSLSNPLDQINNLISSYSHSSSPTISVAKVENKIFELIGSIDFSAELNAIAGTLGNFFVALFSVSFISFFFLKDEGMQNKIVVALTPEKYLDKVHKVINKVKIMLSRYLLGLVGQFAIFTAVTTIGLLIVGVKYAFLIGIIAGLMNLIPYLGPVIGAGFGVLLGITTNLDMNLNQMVPFVLEIISVFAIAQLNDNLLVGPIIFSNTAKSHPIEIYLVVVAAGMLGGVVVMVIAIPLYTIIKVIAQEFLSEFKVVNLLTKNL